MKESLCITYRNAEINNLFELRSHTHKLNPHFVLENGNRKKHFGCIYDFLRPTIYQKK